ncbi:MAG: DUF3575 domain-containing protein [Mediterranea sp.]|jgi:hypothetical protein|nr:DUF3575 domain-containing protein [Mediterranea sp.]
MNMYLKKTLTKAIVMCALFVVTMPCSLSAQQENSIKRDGMAGAPVDVDSLAKALQKRKTVEFQGEYPKDPVLNVQQWSNIHRSILPPKEAVRLPMLALQTNLLYDIGAFTPNLGLELGISPRGTLLLSGSYNPWNMSGASNDNKKLNHWLASLEYRLWLCERFDGHFFGVHGFYGNYNIAGYKIPLILEKGSENYRYYGNVYGAGISYGYHLMLGKHFGMEFTLGVGVGFMKYDRYERNNCGQCKDTGIKRTFVAPTHTGISLIYLIK